MELTPDDLRRLREEAERLRARVRELESWFATQRTDKCTDEIITCVLCRRESCDREFTTRADGQTATHGVHRECQRRALLEATARCWRRPMDDLDEVERLRVERDTAIAQRRESERLCVDEVERFRARLAEIETALLSPIVHNPDAGALAVLVDYVAEMHTGDDPGGCEVCLAVQRARALLEATDGE
jgi:hypothetical protein